MTYVKEFYYSTAHTLPGDNLDLMTDPTSSLNLRLASPAALPFPGDRGRTRELYGLDIFGNSKVLVLSSDAGSG